MIDSTKDLDFNDVDGGKVVGTHSYVSAGNALLNKSAKEIVIPEKYLGVNVIELGYYSFFGTNITAIFIPRFVKTIRHAALWNCHFLKYITFDENNKLESIAYNAIGYTIIESINIPPTWSIYDKTSQTFYSNSLLTCVSYLGTTDLSFNELINESPSSLVAHVISSYSYKIGSYSPNKDGKKCPEYRFPHQLNRNRRCTCFRRTNRVPYNILIVFFVAS